jgi:DNA repair exonuclease SbcCD ATPase subunit
MSGGNSARAGAVGTFSVEVENIGGIDHCDLEFSPGLTVLEGRNASNRTSLLSAVNGALGGTGARLKSDAKTGYVELEFDGETYRRTFREEDGTVKTTGETYADDAETVDTFATLLVENPIRQETRRGGDLRDLLMRPVDTAEIQRQIRDRKRERERTEDRIRELEQERDRLPELQRRRDSKRDELAEVESELEAARETVADANTDRAEASEAQALIDELETKRQRRHELRSRLEHQETEVEELRDRIGDLEASLSDRSVPEDEVDRLERKLEGLREEKRELSNQIDDLLTVISFNDDMLEEDVETVARTESEGGEVTDRLVEDATLVCWTCGTEVEREDIEQRLETLRTIVQEKRAQRGQVDSEISDHEQTLSEYQQTLREHRKQEDTLEDLRSELDHRNGKLAEIRDEREDLAGEIDRLEAEVEAVDDERANEFIEQYEEISELEYERGQLKQTLSELESEIEGLEEYGDELDQLESQRSELEEELESLRRRVETLETDIVDRFNDHMETLVQQLDYRNIERVWLERKVGPEESAAGSFELHIVRESEDGAVYEDTIETLSESERELVGLVLGLTGYVVHDVSDTVPVMLLDSVEAIDRDRLAHLLQYFEDHVDCLLAALLPEDAAAVSADAVSADAI